VELKEFLGEETGELEAEEMEVEAERMLMLVVVMGEPGLDELLEENEPRLKKFFGEKRERWEDRWEDITVRAVFRRWE